ncbi:MAG: hypothetical protein WBE90_07700, partial [Xanthobacteraceae bacterium]
AGERHAFRHRSGRRGLPVQAGPTRLAHRGPLLVNARITSEDTPSVLPLRAGHAIKERFIAALK